MTNQLAGMTALITGAGDGIGLASAQLFAAHGAHVVVADIVEERANKAVEVIKTEGGGAISKIAWSRCGGYLALGSDQGLAAIVELPAQLFK